jgi:hypothetical protein
MDSTIISKFATSGGKYSKISGPLIITMDILEVVIGVIAILINSLAIYILTAKLRLKQSDTILSFIVSVIDLIYSVLSIIHCIVLWATNHSAILTTFYSQLVGYLYSSLGPCTIDSVTLLSLIRFLAIYKKVQYSNRFWVVLILSLTVFNFTFGLIPLIQKQFKVQPSLNYSSVDFNLKNHWSINFYYCLFWIKLFIETIIIMACYFYISVFYYKYLKNYKVDVENSENLSKVNQSNPYRNRFGTESIQLEMGVDNIYQNTEECRRDWRASDSIIGRSAAPVGEQFDTHNDYTIDNLIRSTLSKLYIMIIIYMLEWVPFFLIQTLFKLINMHISSTLDGVGYLLVHLIPLTNPCFVLFFHFETYQELRFFIYLNYYKFFN